jgi:branched-chain amino acid transport system ATP-binding protein
VAPPAGARGAERDVIRALNVDKLRLDTGDYVLSVQGLRKRVRGHDALACVDLDVKRGTCTALVGPAGAGKSLTLACIAGVAAPTAGRVRYFGYEIKGRPQERVVRLGVVRTAAAPRPFGDMTVLETVTVGALLRHGRPGRARAYAREILAATGLEERADARFAALDALDRKRLELARALATDPQVLLLDDLAAGLESSARDSLAAAVATVRERGITVVATARTADHCPVVADNIVAIESGRTAGLGTSAPVDLNR